MLVLPKCNICNESSYEEVFDGIIFWYKCINHTDNDLVVEHNMYLFHTRSNKRARYDQQFAECYSIIVDGKAFSVINRMLYNGNILCEVDDLNRRGNIMTFNFRVEPENLKAKIEKLLLFL